ncbi:LytTR family DNA-binding domain-containing protein [Fulvivirgaceae bacterium PWU4]|uniref:LytTR family DNA-binding domain-containing protein n=1 Tax=Chryseosolibacter histidini TaxID=2782349 RepID=A0AAP2DGF5_9BACT|nr:LytTR family DNA-binding domain-containing protein [Chryseosolibacter histidini]MBT1695928.1 LytTR family DNA-binding domain-containing protein [Chryseosolibacter histidini]
MAEQEKYKMRCMAVDDEPFALRLIADDIRKVPFLELVRTCPTPMEALDHLRKDPVDLLFLDIQMPVMKGTEFLRILDKPPLVIITTAFEQYALEGFELHAIDYLVKPIPFERFLKAVTRARDQYLLLHAKTTEKQDGSFFFVHSEYKKLKIFHHEILYIEGLKDYVKIFLTAQSRPVLTRLNLKAMESKLPAEQFCRIHNSYIVSLPKITSTQKSQVFIQDTAIPIGDKFADAFLKKYRAGI